MSIEPRQALYAHLTADAGVQAAIGNNIYQRRVPSGAQKPLIVIYPPISRTPHRILRGVTHHRARLQVTVIAQTQPEAEAATHAVIAAVEGFTGLMTGGLQVIAAFVESDRQVEQEDIAEIHHHIDVMILYKEEE